MSTEEELRDRAESLVEKWATRFPDARFSGRTPEPVRMSVTAQEVVDLVHSALLTASTPDTGQAPDDQPVGLEKAFIDGWMAFRRAYGSTDPEDVDHGVECPRAHGDRECHCNEDAVRELAELEWSARAIRALLAATTPDGAA